MTIADATVHMLRSVKEEWLDPDLDWKQGGAKKQKCPGCGDRPMGLYPAPLESVVQNRMRASKSTAPSSVMVFRAELFEQLAAHVQGLVPGVLRFADGRVQKHAVTVHSPPAMDVILRGGPGSRACQAYRVCSVCERPLSTIALFEPPTYLLRRSWRSGYEMMVYSLIFPILTESLVRKLNLKPFEDLYLEPIPVLDEPLEPVPELGDPTPGS